MRTKAYRIFFYVLGLLLLAMRLTLNTKAGLGVSPIISVSYSISHITHINFGNTTFGLYGIFVIIEVILHTVRGIRYEKHTDDALQHAGKIDTKLTMICVGRFIALFNYLAKAKITALAGVEE